MRYYSIVITDEKSGQIIRPPGFGSLNIPATYASAIGDTPLPNAWDVELDIYVSSFATPVGDSRVTIWGVSLQEISQSSDLNGKNIQIFGGMKKGLPLANPAQAKLLARGKIFQAFGNWIGTDQTLDIYMFADTGTLEAPKNIIHNWQKGKPLSDAIRQTLQTAFPGYTVNMAINSSIVFKQDDQGFYPTIEQYAAHIKSISKSVIGGDYAGVDIALKDMTFSVYDGSTQPTPIEISFLDLIGQPTWIGPGMMQAKTVMRGDITIGDYVKMPKGLVTTTAAAQSSQVNLRTAFQGNFLVQEVRAVGRFRQADAASWCTILTCAAVNQQAA